MMVDLRQTTIETYNQAAPELAEYFKGIGPRVRHIEYAIELCGVERPDVLEIGCGDGRDAEEIILRANSYHGFDVSDGMVEIAKKRLPDADITVEDAVNFEYPSNINLVIAFASILHLKPQELKTVSEKVAASLALGGIFYISTKTSPDQECEEVIKDDKFGKRLFYYYSQKEIEKLAGQSFKTASSETEQRGETCWLELALRKI